MEEAVPDVDERVLVDVGVPDPVGSHVVVVQRNIIVVDLVLRHGGSRCRTLVLLNRFLGQHGSGPLHEGGTLIQFQQDRSQGNLREPWST